MKVLRSILAAAIVGPVSLLAQAADYPTKPIRFIVPYAAGGAASNVARVASERAQKELGNQTIIIENRSGAGTGVGLDLIAAGAPDGYTIGLTGNSLPILPIMYPDFKRDPVKDFTPIMVLNQGPLVVAANASVPATNFAEFIAWAKKNPGKVNLGASSTSDQLVVLYLNERLGVNITSIPYKGGGPATTAMIAGDVHFVLLPIGTVGPHIQSGRAKALAVTTAKPTPLVPGVPSISSTVPGYDSAFWFGALGPAGMPKDIVNSLHRAYKTALNDPAVIKVITADGTEVVGSTPEEMAETIQRDAKVLGPLARKLAATGS